MANQFPYPNSVKLNHQTADDPESVIVTAAKRLDARNFPLSQVGIQFVQIGTDQFATKFLRELDDELTSSHNIRVRYSKTMMRRILV